MRENHRASSLEESERKSLVKSIDQVVMAESDQKYSAFSAFLIFLFPAFGGLLFGYDIGATSAVIPQLQDAEYSGVKWHQEVEDSALLQGAITSVELVGAMLGCMVCFKVADDLGRRRGLLVAATLFFCGAVIEYISGDGSYDATTGIGILMTGRAVYGFGCGFAMHGAPAYIGEMAPAPIRGMLVSLKEAFIVVGIVLGYSIGYANSKIEGGWRVTYGISSTAAVVMFVGMYFLPPSCRWLALRGRVSEAIDSLHFVSPDADPSEIRALEKMAEDASQAEPSTSLAQDYAMLTSPTVFPAMVAGVGLVVFQQITGQPSVLYYAVTIFEDVGVDTVASIGISLFKLVATLIATFNVDKYGRKLLLYIGCSLMLVALLILGTAFIFPYKGEGDCNDDCTCCGATGIGAQKGIILAALFVYIGGYQVGYGPIAWLLISEIFPLKVRGKAVSIAVVTNFFCNAVVSFIFPVELDTIGSAATFYIYAAILAVGIYFVYRYVPETKGFTLEQIEENFLRSSRQVARVGANDRDKETRVPLL
ncbi:general substrate transporter [Ochromonadaceae sp. CCMP2298]|nr:general substrate transporter [Ochromonadaceae sp. CCMP2298]